MADETSDARKGRPDDDVACGEISFTMKVFTTPRRRKAVDSWSPHAAQPVEVSEVSLCVWTSLMARFPYVPEFSCFLEWAEPFCLLITMLSARWYAVCISGNTLCFDPARIP